MRLRRQFHFEASHILPDSKGPCQGLHGHSFLVDIGVLGDPKLASGSTFDDSNYLKHLVTPIIQRLNGQHLNYLMQVPTVENVCLYIAHELCEYKLSYCRVEVPSLFSAEWNLGLNDAELLLWHGDSEFSEFVGWHDTFEEIPAFATMQARAKWVVDHQRTLRKLYRKMTEVGSELAAFDRYKASLDKEEAEKLLAYIQQVESEVK
jgi:6-pyruvoyltetrahydropterin/6-carboxytetrahydropterin synthase